MIIASLSGDSTTSKEVDRKSNVATYYKSGSYHLTIQQRTGPKVTGVGAMYGDGMLTFCDLLSNLAAIFTIQLPLSLRLLQCSRFFQVDAQRLRLNLPNRPFEPSSSP